MVSLYSTDSDNRSTDVSKAQKCGSKQRTQSKIVNYTIRPSGPWARNLRQSVSLTSLVKGNTCASRCCGWNSIHHLTHLDPYSLALRNTGTCSRSVSVSSKCLLPGAAIWRRDVELLDSIISLSRKKIMISITSFVGGSCARVRSSQSTLHHQERPPSRQQCLRRSNRCRYRQV